MRQGWSHDTGQRGETWTWDVSNKSPDVVLSADRTAAYFHTDPVIGSTGTAGKQSTTD